MAQVADEVAGATNPRHVSVPDQEGNPTAVGRVYLVDAESTKHETPSNWRPVDGSQFDHQGQFAAASNWHAPQPKRVDLVQSLALAEFAQAGAYASIALGILSLPIALISHFAIISAGLGIALGVWGLRSKNRNIAIAGIALCLLIFFFSSYLGGVAFVRWIVGARELQGVTTSGSIDVLK